MATYYKYEKYLKYINGVPTEEYKQGNIMGTGEYSSKKDCEEGAIYRWIDSGETICDGYKLCVKLIKLKSTDGSVTWVTTEETRAGQVVDLWSTKCGAVIKYRWNPTSNTRCNGYSEEAEYAYLVSYTMGTVWQDVEPRQTKWETTDVFTNECFLASKPFTFTFDAGEEGAELELNTIISTLYSYWTEDGPYGPPYSPDPDKYIMYWYSNGFTKYAIDWGDNEELVLDEFISYYNQKSDPYWKTSPKPENPFINLKITSSVNLGNHIYRTGGIKTVKIWGNISYFGCKQVKDFIHWGYPMFNALLKITRGELLGMLTRRGTQVCDPSTGNCHNYLGLAGAKTEGYDNFNKVETTFTGTTFGTMYLNTFNYLTHFDMSNSPNCTYPNPPSKFNSFGRLETFIANNCAGMIWGPNLSYLRNNKSTVLKTISFKNCTSLTTGPIVEMPLRSSSVGVIIPELNLGSEGVFKNCPNIEELPFTYNVNINTVDFKHHPKLHRITGLLTADDTPFLREYLFYLMCKGLTNLQDIKNLTLRGCGFKEAFMNCTMLAEVCKTVITLSTSELNTAYLYFMYSNTRMRTVDISSIFENEFDPIFLDCSYMFYNCPELTTVTGNLSVNQHIVNNVKFISMFENCSKLTTISAIFSNKTLLPNMTRMFKSCNITSIPNDLFNQTYEDIYPNAPMYMFANNVHLTNYPIDNLIPMWKLLPFFFGEIIETYAFLGCTPILAEVPRLWGGYSDVNPVKVRVSISHSDYTLSYKYSDDYSSSVIMKSADATNLRNDLLHFASSGTYEVDIYLTGTNEVAIPSITTEIISLGDAYDLDYQTFNTAAQAPPITKMPYGKKFCSNYTAFDFMGGYAPPWYLINWITDVDDNILENCGNVIKINGSTYGGVFCMNLSTEKYTTMFSYLTNLQEIHGLFNWNYVSVTSTCGIFKNNPSLTNISEALGNSKLLTIAVDEFSNNKELVNVDSVFTLCTELTNMPNFRENKKITNFSYAFSGCSKLTGSTPTDENGYKLWERAGKEGYPATINGQYCFRGCTLLDDYDEIPDNWK